MENNRNYNDFPIIESFEYGFKKTWQHLGLVLMSTIVLGLIIGAIVAVAVMLGLAGVLSSLAVVLKASSKYPLFGAILSVVALVLIAALCGMGFVLGYYKLMLEIKDKDRSTISVIWSILGKGLRGFIALILYNLIFAFGIGLLVIPAFLLGGRLFYFPFFIVDQNAGAIESLQMSWAATKGYTMYATLFLLMFMAVSTAGSIAFGIGALFTTPVAILAQAYIYRWLQRK